MADDLILVSLLLPRSTYVTLRETSFRRGSTVSADLERDAIAKANRLRRGTNHTLEELHARNLSNPEIAARLDWTNLKVARELAKLGLTANARPRYIPTPRKREKV